VDGAHGAGAGKPCWNNNNQTEAHPPAGSGEAQQDVAQPTDTKAATAAKASDELTEDDLEAVAGGGAGGIRNF